MTVADTNERPLSAGRTKDCLSWADIEGMAQEGTDPPADKAKHIEDCRYCLNMITLSRTNYRKRLAINALEGMLGEEEEDVVIGVRLSLKKQAAYEGENEEEGAGAGTAKKPFAWMGVRTQNEETALVLSSDTDKHAFLLLVDEDDDVRMLLPQADLPETHLPARKALAVPWDIREPAGTVRFFCILTDGPVDLPAPEEARDDERFILLMRAVATEEDAIVLHRKCQVVED